MNLIKKVVLVIIAMVLPLGGAFAQPVSTEQAGGALRQQMDIERQNSMGRRIQRWEARKKPAEDMVDSESKSMTSSPKVKVNAVRVEGAQVIGQDKIDEILSKNFVSGQEMTFEQMRSLADDITAAYRQKGYVTSRAYIPPQSLDQGTLIIKVMESRMGDYTISGNKYFKKDQLIKTFDVLPGERFDYNALQKSLKYLNKHPDRKVQAVLAPGKDQGTTDVNLQVQDQAPVHALLEYDNWASRYLNKDRLGLTIEHNNLTKHDDRLTLKGLISEGDNLEVMQGRYVYPVTNSLELGGYFIASQTDLGMEFEDLSSHGEADVFGVFATKELLSTASVDVNGNIGFDHKNIKNYLLGSQQSFDRVRMLKAGVDVDIDDFLGRSIASLEWDFGLPEIMGGMEDDNDPEASRTGAGGEFDKAVVNFFRLQPLPSDIKYLNETYFLWKNTAQYSDDILLSSEEFQLGGATSVRGYAPGEVGGDSGIYSALEWSFPIFGLDRRAKIMNRPELWYDCLRGVIFYDWGWASLANPQPGEEKDETLRGYGAGLRLNISQDVAARVEVAWPQGKRSEDGRRMHTWVELDVRF